MPPRKNQLSYLTYAPGPNRSSGIKGQLFKLGLCAGDQKIYDRFTRQARDITTGKEKAKQPLNGIDDPVHRFLGKRGTEWWPAERSLRGGVVEKDPQKGYVFPRDWNGDTEGVAETIFTQRIKELFTEIERMEANKPPPAQRTKGKRKAESEPAEEEEEEQEEEEEEQGRGGGQSSAPKRRRGRPAKKAKMISQPEPAEESAEEEALSTQETTSPRQTSSAVSPRGGEAAAVLAALPQAGLYGQAIQRTKLHVWTTYRLDMPPVPAYLSRYSSPTFLYTMCGLMGVDTEQLEAVSIVFTWNKIRIPFRQLTHVQDWQEMLERIARHLSRVLPENETWPAYVADVEVTLHMFGHSYKQPYYYHVLNDRNAGEPLPPLLWQNNAWRALPPASGSQPGPSPSNPPQDDPPQGDTQQSTTQSATIQHPTPQHGDSARGSPPQGNTQQSDTQYATTQHGNSPQGNTREGERMQLDPQGGNPQPTHQETSNPAPSPELQNLARPAIDPNAHIFARPARPEFPTSDYRGGQSPQQPIRRASTEASGQGQGDAEDRQGAGSQGESIDSSSDELAA